MTAQASKDPQRRRGEVPIRELVVRGFKSHRDHKSIKMRPLTILAGANSSGKSSVMQPLLLLKQTFDSPFDPGPLKLDGPNVYFTEPSQFLCYRKGHGRSDRFEIGVTLDDGWHIGMAFVEQDHGIRLDSVTYRQGEREVVLREGRELKPEDHSFFGLPEQAESGSVVAVRSLALLVPGLPRKPLHVGRLPFLDPAYRLVRSLARTIHLPEHRGNPTRSYPRTAVGRDRPGLFHDYVATLVAQWAEKGDPRLDRLSSMLRQTGLGWKVTAKPKDAASIEIRVSRTSKPAKGGAKDLVSVADVGFGVSQALPVLVALVVAEQGQLVYIEQPEIHLHPAAQKGLADLIVDAVRGGAQLVVETHSEIILTRLQANVAKGGLPPDQVIAHWFSRDKDGMSKVESAEPDSAGAFGEWPADFADVAAEVDQDYLDAAQAKLFESEK